MKHIRQAKNADLARIAEIEIFNYRLYFYPIFRDDAYYFDTLQVPSQMALYEADLPQIWVYDDGAVKGFIWVRHGEVVKLFVEPVLHGCAIGSALLAYAVDALEAKTLWALEKNVRAIAFYKRHGFCVTNEKKLEEDTTEYLVRMER